MTNEAIIQQFEPNREYPSYYHESNVFEAMDAARRDEAMDFLLFAIKKCNVHSNSGRCHKLCSTGDWVSTEQLYSLFKNNDI